MLKAGDHVRMRCGLVGAMAGKWLHGTVKPWLGTRLIVEWRELPTATELPNPNVEVDPDYDHRTEAEVASPSKDANASPSPGPASEVLHTQECLEYAAKTRHAYCIVSCAERRRANRALKPAD